MHVAWNQSAPDAVGLARSCNYDVIGCSPCHMLVVLHTAMVTTDRDSQVKLVWLLLPLQVRALQSTPFKSDRDHFLVMASASISLCRAYLAAAAAGQGGLRDLAAARMHLRGMLKQCEERFADEAACRDMEQLLQEVVDAENAAVAAKKAAEM